MMKTDLTDLVWTTRDGVEIPIRKMRDNHLINAYNHLIEKAIDGECGTGCWGVDAEDMFYDPEPTSEAIDLLKGLVFEIEKRGLLPKDWVERQVNTIDLYW